MAKECYRLLQSDFKELIKEAMEKTGVDEVVNVTRGKILGDRDSQSFSSLVDSVHMMNTKISQLTYTFGGGVVGHRKF